MAYVQPDPVILVDSSGNPYTAGGGGGSADFTATNTKLDTLHTDLTGTQPRSVPSVTVSGNLTALNATVDGTTDLTLYSTVKIVISGTFVGNITPQYSHDGSTWNTLTVFTGTNGSTSGISAPNTAYSPIAGRYFRALMGSYTSGTATVSITYQQGPAPVSVAQLSPTSNSIGAVNISSGAGRGPVNFSLTSAATTNATSLVNGGRWLQEVSIFNPTSAPVFLKFYQKGSAPTVGTDVPILTIPVGAGGYAIENFGPNGKSFSTGIAYALTANGIATDATAVGAGVQVHGTYV